MSTSPHDLMRQWNPKCRHHGIPIWLSALCRAYLKREGKYETSSWPMSAGFCIQDAFHHAAPGASIYDHIGDIPGDEKGMRHFYVQPYIDFESGLEAAQRIADTLGIRLVESKREAPWSEEACFFLFGPRVGREARAEGVRHR